MLLLTITGAEGMLTSVKVNETKQFVVTTVLQAGKDGLPVPVQEKDGGGTGGGVLLGHPVSPSTITTASSTRLITEFLRIQSED